MIIEKRQAPAANPTFMPMGVALDNVMKSLRAPLDLKAPRKPSPETSK